MDINTKQQIIIVVIAICFYITYKLYNKYYREGFLTKSKSHQKINAPRIRSNQPDELSRSVSAEMCEKKPTTITSSEISSITNYCGKVNDCQIVLDSTKSSGKSCVPSVKEFQLRSAIIVGVTDAWTPFSAFNKEQRPMFKDMEWKDCIDTVLKQGICAFHFTIVDNNKSTVRDKKYQLIQHGRTPDKDASHKDLKSFFSSIKDNPYLEDVIPYLIDSAFSSTIRKGHSDNMLIIYLNVNEPFKKRKKIKLNTLFNVQNVESFKKSNVTLLMGKMNPLDIPLTHLNGDKATIIIFINYPVPDTEPYLHYANEHGLIETEHNSSERIIKNISKSTNTFSVNLSKNDYSKVPLLENNAHGLYFGPLGNVDIDTGKSNTETTTTPYLVEVYGNNRSYIVANPKTTELVTNRDIKPSQSLAVVSQPISNPTLGRT